MLLPTVLNEQLISPFNFFLNGEIQQGMRHQDELYGHLDEFDTRSRLQAYQTACRLMEQAVPVLMTASSQRYVIWVNLRSTFYQSWSSSGRKRLDVDRSMLSEPELMLVASEPAHPLPTAR